MLDALARGAEILGFWGAWVHLCGTLCACGEGYAAWSGIAETAERGRQTGTTHTATADGGSFNTGSIADGGTSALITMGTAGAFSYHCSFHPTMVGTLNVNP